MTLTTALKLHLRVLEVHGRTLRVVTLRPQLAARFSTNYFHDTWHILAGNDGAALLGRLLWGLAFQRHAGTLILIDAPHLVPTPFEADPPAPILLIPDGLTSVDDDVLRALKLRLRRAPGAPTTIGWHTFGMAEARVREDTRHWRWRIHERNDPKWHRERMSRRAGFVCYTAPPAVLRAQGLGIYDMHDQRSGYHPLADRPGNPWRGYDGEFQLIASFTAQVSAAQVARRAVVGDEPGLLAERDVRWAVYAEAERALGRRVAAGRVSAATPRGGSGSRAPADRTRRRGPRGAPAADRARTRSESGAGTRRGRSAP
jgi:hypothetical protein